jgi:hypothetical protein
MVPDIYEKLLHERRQTWLHEAEQTRRLVEAQHTPLLYSLHGVARRLGRYLIVTGTRLQRVSVER